MMSSFDDLMMTETTAIEDLAPLNSGLSLDLHRSSIVLAAQREAETAMTPNTQHRWVQVAVFSLVLIALFCVGAALAANGSVTYTYDALGRVTMVNYDTGVCIMYSYDANGNRLSETIVVSATGATGVWGCFKWGQGLWGP